MQVTFYIDQNNQEVLNPAQYREKLTKAADELFANDGEEYEQIALEL